MVGGHGQQLGFGVRRVCELTTPLQRAAAQGQQPVHGAYRAQVAALVEQGGVHGSRGRVGEAFAVERGQQQLVLLGVERQRRTWSGCLLGGSDEGGSSACTLHLRAVAC